MLLSNKLLLTLSVAATALIATPFFPGIVPVLAAPVPSVLPVSWELDFTIQPPERMIINDDKGQPRVYWYVRYKAVNNTKEDQLFTPEFKLLTDTGQVIESGKGVPTIVFDSVKALYQNELMDSPVQVLGRIKQGPDNAKESVAIFADVDKDSRKFRIVVTGLFGETAQVKNPLTGKTVILNKALVLDYDVPGEAIGINPSATLRAKSYQMK